MTDYQWWKVEEITLAHSWDNYNDKPKYHVTIIYSELPSIVYHYDELLDASNFADFLRSQLNDFRRNKDG